MIELITAFLISVGIGFTLNRFVLKKRIRGKKTLALALAISRAAFYAPSLIHVGHGAYIPGPLLITIYYSFLEFAPELDLFVFLLPCIVLLSSLAVPWSIIRNAQQRVPGDAPKAARP